MRWGRHFHGLPAELVRRLSRGRRAKHGGGAVDLVGETARISWERGKALRDGVELLRPSRAGKLSGLEGSLRGGPESRPASSESPAPQRIAWMSEHGIYAQLVVDRLVRPPAFLSLAAPTPVVPVRPAGVARLLGPDASAGAEDHRPSIVSRQTRKVLCALSGRRVSMPLRDAVDLRTRRSPVEGCWFDRNGKLHGLGASAGYVGVRRFVCR